jgi:hypothetical protein
MESATTSRFGAREVGVRGRVNHPRGLSAFEHAPWQTFAGPERKRFAQRLEFLRACAGVPGSDAVQVAFRGVELPDGAQLPTQRSADRLQRRLVDLDGPFPFSEDPGDPMLDAAQIALLGDRPAIRRRSRHDFR